MTSHYFIVPNETISKLKCDLCQGYLSIPPIYSYKDKYACGRCNPEWERNIIYEELAKHTIFPCMYCDVTYTWELLPMHETKCKRHKLLCPSNDSMNPNQGLYHSECCKQIISCPFNFCQRNFEVIDILQHFNKHHNEYVFANIVKAKKILKEEKVWNFQPETNVCLLMMDTIPFLLFINNGCDFDEKTGEILYYNYYFTVFTFCLHKCDLKYSATVQMQSRENVEDTKTMKNQIIKTFNGKNHSKHFFQQHLFKLNRFDFTTTQFTKLERRENLILTYSVQITDKLEIKLDDKLKMQYEKQTNQAKGIERNVECPICKDYMCAPIYNCPTGHTICKNCRNKLILCPYCQVVLGNSRNYVLEDISESLLVKCHNQYKGCPVTGVVNEIKLHEVMCPYV